MMAVENEEKTERPSQGRPGDVQQALGEIIIDDMNRIHTRSTISLLPHSAATYQSFLSAHS